MAVRTPAPASNAQYVQPVDASRAYTLPPALPTNNFPWTMEGCENATKSPAKPNAHLSLSLGTWLGARPADSADWKRLFSRSELQPFHSDRKSEKTKIA